MRRSLTAGLLAIVVLAGVAGCYPTAGNAIADLERFALTLDGVESVESLRDTPENMAFPFGGTALGTAAIHLDDSWREELPEVAIAVHDWLATEQKREKVKLSVGIVYPAGAVGLATLASETRDRLELVELLVDDPAVTGHLVGFSTDGTIDAENDSLVAVLGRDPSVTIGSVLGAWAPALAELAPSGAVQVVVDADLGDEASDADTASRREFLAATSILPDAPVVAWADAVDANSAVTGWRVGGDGRATVYAADAAQLNSLEAELRALPGFEAITSLTLVTPELTVESGSGDSTAARELATALAAAGISDVSLVGGVLTIGSLDPGTARTMLATAAAVPEGETVLVDLEISLGEPDANPCACIRVGDASLGYLASVLPPLLDLDPTSLDHLWIRDETGVDASYESDDRTAMGAFFSAVREEAIARGLTVGVSAGGAKDYYIAQFEAAAQISSDDVWSGNNDTPQDKRHAEIIDLWNSLDN